VLIFITGGMARRQHDPGDLSGVFPGHDHHFGPYPGADPEEVEEGISRKIEEAIEGLEGIKQYTTKSRENYGTAMIEVKEDYDVDEVLDGCAARWRPSPPSRWMPKNR
jgi:hypothetical protein